MFFERKNPNQQKTDRLIRFLQLFSHEIQAKP